MTALIVVAGILTGVFVGGCLAMAAAFAAMSRSQERMQRKVRYWQAETTRVRAGAQATAEASGQLAVKEPAPDRPARPGPGREPWVW
jgi:outer membrane lipoprotein-sorting protein